MIYSYSEAREKLATLLKKAISEGEVKFKNKEGLIFTIRPERTPKKSPFEVRSVKLPITKLDILESIRESRARF
jgi:hypothetical protein